jgi:hypothetical protein
MSPDAKKIFATLEARRLIYATKQWRAEQVSNLSLNYDREDLFRHARETMEWAINEALQAIGEPIKCADD